MSAPVFEMPFVAAPEHIDMLGHVNNAVWIQWMEQVSVTHWESVASAEHQRDYFWVVVRHEVDYLRPAFDGDRITARTWAEPPTGAKSVRNIEFLGNDGRPCVKARTNWAIIDKAAGRPIRVPADVIAPFLDAATH
jgi:acyl-CoA thioester hydrolase